MVKIVSEKNYNLKIWMVLFILSSFNIQWSFQTSLDFPGIFVLIIRMEFKPSFHPLLERVPSPLLNPTAFVSHIRIMQRIIRKIRTILPRQPRASLSHHPIDASAKAALYAWTVRR